jgi:hypothetical protein
VPGLNREDLLPQADERIKVCRVHASLHGACLVVLERPPRMAASMRGSNTTWAGSSISARSGGRSDTAVTARRIASTESDSYRAQSAR